MRAWTLGALVFAILIGIAIRHTLYWGEDLQAAEFAYPAKPGKTPCAKGDAPDPDRSLPRLRVQTPTNYRADYAHGLLVVFSPAGFGPALTERFMGLTHMATSTC